MTTWLKKLRLYLLRRQLKAVLDECHATSNIYTWVDYCDRKADLIDRIAEIEKTL